MAPVLIGTGVSPALRIVERPRLEHFGDVPLSGLLTVAGDAPSELLVRLWSDEEVIQIRWPGLAVEHEVPILGMKPGRDWVIEVCLLDAWGRPTPAGQVKVQTPELPGDFPLMDVFSHVPEAAEPGLRLLNLTLQGQGASAWLVAFDAVDLEVAWYLTLSEGFNDVRRTSRGTLLGIQGDPVERDFLGRLLRRWTPHPIGLEDRLLPVGNVHHELFPMEDGSLLALHESRHRSAAYPTSYDDPDTLGGPADLLASEVVRFTGEGELLWAWPLAERLDDARIGFDSLDWEEPEGEPPGFDWDHTNGVVPHPDGGVIVSVRHQDVLVRLDASGSVRWLLGDPAGWSPEFLPLFLQPRGPIRWPYHQHAPALTDDGLLVVFDNHNNGHTPYTPAPAEPWQSRVVAYRIDEAAHAVEEAWSFEPEGAALRAEAQGDADPLPLTGHVLATFGLVTSEERIPNTELGMGSRTVRLVEFAPDGSEPAALDVRLWTPLERPDGGVKSYRAEAIPSLYPDGVEVLRLEDAEPSSW